VSRLGDLWIPKSSVSPNNFPRFYILGVEDLFQVGDCIVRVEHSGSKSRLISWRMWRDSESSGNSSRNPQMSNVFLFFRRILNL
jgi:hypothetical protein